MQKKNYLDIPIEYLKVSQCSNFIMADPQNIFHYVVEFPKYEKYLEGETPLISDEFKTRLKAHFISPIWLKCMPYSQLSILSIGVNESFTAYSQLVSSQENNNSA